MSSQTSLSTESARNAAVQNTADYSASVAAHVAGDWGKHAQVKVYDQAFNSIAKAAGATYANHPVTDAKCLRLLVTVNGSNLAIIVPAIPIGSYTGGGTDSGSPNAEAPTITLAPISAELYVGDSYSLTIEATGTAPIFYQWTKNGVAIPGATSSTYSISSFAEADAGNYTCLATNSVGQAVSSTAVLSVRVTSTSDIPERSGVSGGCLTKNTFVTLANGVQQPITSIRRGDVVRSYDIEGLNPDLEDAWKTFAQSSLTATPKEATVKEVLLNQFGYYYLVNGDLEITYEHVVLAKRGNVWKFMHVESLKPGDYLFRNGSAALLKSIVRVETPIQTWNLNVEPYDVFLANGFIVHNVVYKY